MAQPITTPFGTVLQAIAAQVTLVTGIPTERVLLVAKDKVPQFQADQDILIRASKPIYATDLVEGAGREGTVIKRILNITPRTRLNVDLSSRDDYWLTNPILGQYALEELILVAVHLFQPVDAFNNVLTQDFIKWIDGETAIKETGDPEWGKSGLNFVCLYQISTPFTTAGF